MLVVVVRKISGIRLALRGRGDVVVMGPKGNHATFHLHVLVFSNALTTPMQRFRISWPFRWSKYEIIEAI